jgi:hypothetical protein
MWQPTRFKAGDRVVVRSREEILATLDAQGCLEHLPFMPEMLQFCGKELTVAAAAHKTCDPAYKTGGRRLDRSVHLAGSRCDGSAHGGCQAECNLFWKDAWLAPAPAPRGAPTPESAASRGPSGAPSGLQMTEREAAALPTGNAERYICQATEIVRYSTQLPWWNVRQYLLDVRSRNHSLGAAARVLAMSWCRQLLRLPVGFRFWSRVSDWIHRRLTGHPAPRVHGLIPPGGKTPTGTLDLQPGELVRVKALREIETTLDCNSKNRGMWFDAEQVAFCERRFVVRRRVDRIIDERTGKMTELKNPCITLEGVLCSGHVSSQRLLCPRAITPYWREVWLERVKP